MSKNERMNRTGRILPFERTGERYFRQALAKVENNNLLGACASYQLALVKEPHNSDYILGFAEMLTGMGRFDDSNRVLLCYFPDVQKRPAECYFGMGCNFYGLMEYTSARTSLERYLDVEPEGNFVYDAYDMLDALDEYGDGNLEDLNARQKRQVLEKARNLLSETRFDEAAEILKKELAERPDHMEAQCDLALTWYCMGAKDKAKKELGAVLKAQPENVQARCTRALFLQGEEKLDAAKEEAAKLMQISIENPDDLHRASLTLMELGEYEDARTLLGKMGQYAPYDTGILHRLGVCAYALEDYNRAAYYYDMLLRIDASDSIARYYRKLCRKTAAGAKKRRELPSHYQVPMDEVVLRVRRLNSFIGKPIETQRAEWHAGGEMMDLVCWCLTLSDDTVRQAALNLVASFGDVWSEHILRDFALRREPGEDIKRKALGLLKHIGAKEPYLTYIDDEIMESHVSLLPSVPDNLPSSYGDVLKICVEGMRSERDEKVILRAGSLWSEYLASDTHFPHLTNAQVTALAAALEYVACQAEDISVTKLEICRKYGVSMLRFNGALAKISEKERKT
ncbi:MAG: tetratricopeptide repeat protein [Candidatus Pelethousia sp.]|nr:tetratricopeptide repeat protein [Candidatus Pelethousia sp.]